MTRYMLEKCPDVDKCNFPLQKPSSDPKKSVAKFQSQSYKRKLGYIKLLDTALLQFRLN